MNTIPTITEQDIRNIIDPASFQRGQTYYNSDAIFNTRQQGMAMKARCQGSRSQAYRVEVTFNNAGIVSNQCSCPLGGHCKHVAALLLTWIRQVTPRLKPGACSCRRTGATIGRLTG